MAQSHRLSASNRATLTRLGRPASPARIARTLAGGTGSAKRSAIPFGRISGSTPDFTISARMNREIVVMVAARARSGKVIDPKPYVLFAFQNGVIACRRPARCTSTEVLIAAFAVCQSSNRSTARLPCRAAGTITSSSRCGGTVRPKSRHLPSSPS